MRPDLVVGQEATLQPSTPSLLGAGVGAWGMSGVQKAHG